MKTQMLVVLTVTYAFANLVNAQPSRVALTDSLSRFEQQYKVGSFRFDTHQTYVSGPAWVNGTVVSERHGFFRSDGSLGIHLERIQSDEDGYHSLAYEIPEGYTADDFAGRITRQQGVIRTANSYVAASGSSGESAKINLSVRGTLKNNNGEGDWHIFGRGLNLLFGYDGSLFASNTKFSDLLLRYPPKIMKSELAGIRCWSASASTPVGNLTVWFSADNDNRVCQITLERNSDHFYSEQNGSLQINETVGFCCAADGPKLVRQNQVYSSLKFMEIDGERFCNGFIHTLEEEHADGKNALVKTTVKITDIDLHPAKIKSHSVDFELFTVSDRTRFRELDDPRIPYMISNGEICKVVNEKTLESLEGIRFHMPNDRFSTPVILVLLVLSVFVSLLLYKKIRFKNS